MDIHNGGIILTHNRTNLNNEELLYDFDSVIYNHEEDKDLYVIRISNLEKSRNAQYAAMKTAKD